MTIDWPYMWLQFNAVVGLVVALLIYFYERNGARHKPFISLLAWLAMIALISIPVRVWFGNYTVVDRSEVIVNVVLLVVMINSRGNITGKRG